MSTKKPSPLQRELKKYMREHGLKFSTFAALVRDRGGSVTAAGAHHWCTGRAKPTERNRRALSKILDVDIDAIELMSHGFEPTAGTRA